MPLNPRVECFNVCDFVRIENNGKFFLIGVYPGRQVALLKIPGRAVLSFYVEFISSYVGTFSGDFAIFGGGAVRVSQPISFAVTSSDRPTAVYISDVPIEVQEGQRFDMMWRANGGEYEQISNFWIEPPRTQASFLSSILPPDFGDRLLS